MSVVDSTQIDIGSGTPSMLFGFDVVDFIGEGAGSVIYVVSDPDTKQLFALKRVVRTTEKHARFIDQLENEYEVAGKVHHPALRRALDMKTHRTLLRKVVEAGLVMELFDGVPLDVAKNMNVMKLIDVFINVAEGLQSMHEMGYIHCDLKPNNILVSATGEVKVIDFGQACRIGAVKDRIQGTPDFISPEQVKGDPVTVRTDVFNLGATMYWTLTGSKIPTLFTLKKTQNSFLVDGAMKTPADLNPKIPETLSGLVMDCVRNNPAKRPESMNEVARRLQTIRHGLLRKSPQASA